MFLSSAGCQLLSLSFPREKLPDVLCTMEFGLELELSGLMVGSKMVVAVGGKPLSDSTGGVAEYLFGMHLSVQSCE